MPAIGAGVERINHFPAVRQTVGIRVRQQRIGAVDRCFHQIVQAVVVGIRGLRIRVQSQFQQVGQPVAVRIAGRVVGQRIEPVDGFPSIRHGVVVRIRIERIGADNQDFRAIVQGVAVRIRQEGIGAPRDFRGVVQAVAVRIGGLRIGAVALFLQVGQTIGIRIAGRIVGQRIEPVRQFPCVEQAIAIGIRGGRIGGVDGDLRVVRQSVAVGVRLAGVRVQFPFAAVVQAVRVGIAQPIVDGCQCICIQRGSENPHVVDLAAPITFALVHVAIANPQFRLAGGLERARDDRDEAAFDVQPRRRAIVRECHVHPATGLGREPVGLGYQRIGGVATAENAHHAVVLSLIAQGKPGPIAAREVPVRHDRRRTRRRPGILPNHGRHGEGRAGHHGRSIRLGHRNEIVDAVEPQRLAAASRHPVAFDHGPQRSRPIGGNRIRRDTARTRIERPTRHETMREAAVRNRIELVVHFPPVRQAVAVRVRIPGMAVPILFLQIGQAVHVGIIRRIGQPWIQAVRHFPAIPQAVVVGIGILGIGPMHQHFGGVVQVVVVRVDRQRIRPVRRDFGGIAQTVAVRIGVLRVRAVAEFLGVRQAVVVRILGRVAGQWIQAHGHFPRVGKTVAVGIHGPRIGAIDHDFLVIVESVAVRVRRQRIGAVGHHLRAIVQAVVVRIRPRGMGAVRFHFDPIRQAVAVRVAGEWIGAVGVFLGMVQAIAVRIARGGFLEIAEPMEFPGVREAVRVGVHQLHRRRGGRPGADVEIGIRGAAGGIESQDVEHAAHAPMQRHARRHGIGQQGPVVIRRARPDVGAGRGEIRGNAELPVVGLGLLQRRPTEPQDRISGGIARDRMADQRTPQLAETAVQPNIGNLGDIVPVLPLAGIAGPVHQHIGRERHHYAGLEFRRSGVGHVLLQPSQVVRGVRDAVDDVGIGKGMGHHEAAESGVGCDGELQSAQLQQHFLFGPGRGSAVGKAPDVFHHHPVETGYFRKQIQPDTRSRRPGGRRPDKVNGAPPMRVGSVEIRQLARKTGHQIGEHHLPPFPPFGPMIGIGGQNRPIGHGLVQHDVEGGGVARVHDAVGQRTDREPDVGMLRTVLGDHVFPEPGQAVGAGRAAVEITVGIEHGLKRNLVEEEIAVTRKQRQFVSPLGQVIADGRSIGHVELPHLIGVVDHPEGIGQLDADLRSVRRRHELFGPPRNGFRMLVADLGVQMDPAAERDVQTLFPTDFDGGADVVFQNVPVLRRHGSVPHPTGFLFRGIHHLGIPPDQDPHVVAGNKIARAEGPGNALDQRPGSRARIGKLLRRHSERRRRIGGHHAAGIGMHVRFDPIHSGREHAIRPGSEPHAVGNHGGVPRCLDECGLPIIRALFPSVGGQARVVDVAEVRAGVETVDVEPHFGRGRIRAEAPPTGRDPIDGIGQQEAAGHEPVVADGMVAAVRVQQQERQHVVFDVQVDFAAGIRVAEFRQILERFVGRPVPRHEQQVEGTFAGRRRCGGKRVLVRLPRLQIAQTVAVGIAAGIEQFAQLVGGQRGAVNPHVVQQALPGGNRGVDMAASDAYEGIRGRLEGIVRLFVPETSVQIQAGGAGILDQGDMGPTPTPPFTPPIGRHFFARDMKTANQSDDLVLRGVDPQHEPRRTGISQPETV